MRRRRTERNQALYAKEPSRLSERNTPHKKPKKNWREGLLLCSGLIVLGMQQGIELLAKAFSTLSSWLRMSISTIREWHRTEKGKDQDVPYWHNGYIPPEQDEMIRRKKHRRTRYFHDGRRRLSVSSKQVLIACLVIVAIVSVGNVIHYYWELQQSKALSDALREAYYAELAAQTSTPMPTSTPLPTSAPTSMTTPTPRATASPAPTQAVLLETVRYPDNPYAAVRSRFQKLQRQNEDIIAWLTIPDVLDEAVVQRDNSYYLRRDYRGYHNDNGAIFMEKTIALNKTRPYTLILYGHNMRSGAMFGCLRNFENIYFYRKNAFITFDTAYEDGRYVIFAVGTLNQKEGTRNYVNVSKLLSTRIVWREEALAQLKKSSVISGKIDVNTNDQILVLITCVDDDTERRFVAARRIRTDETEEQLQELVDRSKTK